MRTITNSDIECVANHILKCVGKRLKVSKKDIIRIWERDKTLRKDYCKKSLNLMKADFSDFDEFNLKYREYFNYGNSGDDTETLNVYEFIKELLAQPI